MAAGLALPRIKPAVGATSALGALAGVAGAAFQTSLVGSGQVSIAQASAGRLGSAYSHVAHADGVAAGTYNFIQMTRQYPVIPGGVGPHPAREPVPV